MIHAAAFLVASMFAPSDGERVRPVTMSTVWRPPAPELAPEPESPPPDLPLPERPEYDDETMDEPAPLDTPWEPVTIAVATRTGVNLSATPRARPRSHPAPAPSPQPILPPPPPPPPPDPPPVVAAHVEPQPQEKTPPRLLSREDPVYPDEASAAGIEGTVVLVVRIEADGSIGEVRVVESTGSEILDRAAISCVRRWKFAAATCDGVPVAREVKIPAIKFRLISHR